MPDRWSDTVPRYICRRVALYVVCYAVLIAPTVAATVLLVGQ